MNKENRKRLIFEAVTGECQSTMDPCRWPGLRWKSRIGWHHGRPEWQAPHSYDKNMRTLYLPQSGYGCPPDETIGAWELVETRIRSHETPCPLCGDGTDGDRDTCPLRETAAIRRSHFVHYTCEDGMLTVPTVLMAVYRRKGAR